MNSAKKHIEYFEDFRCKVIEHLKSFVPDDFVITMRCAHWPPFRLLVERLFDPDAPVRDELKKYDIEWVNTTIPCYFHTDPIQFSVISNLKFKIKPLESHVKNCSDEQMTQNACLKFIGWDGLICVSEGNEKLYLCNVRHYSNGRPIGFLFAAYNNLDFVERLITDYWKAEGEEL